MKAILEFDLNKENDYREYLNSTAAADMHSALFEITRNLRKQIRWEIEQNKELQSDGFKVLNRVFERINEECSEIDHILDL